MKTLILILTLALLMGCTVNVAQLKEEYAISPTPALALEIKIAEEANTERELKYAKDRENWAICEAILKHNRVVIWHNGHRHHRLGRITHFSITSDLRDNLCKQVVPKEWWVQ